MKKWQIMMMISLFVFGSVVAVMADSTLAPAATKYVIGTPTGLRVVKATTIADIKILQVKGNEVLFDIPVLNTKDGDYQVYASYAWSDGQEWVLVPKEDYLIESTLVNRVRTSRIILPKLGNGWYWIRVWGQDKKSREWLWINQKSIYIRYDTQGKPGYEFLANLDGRHQPVPTAYQTRK